MTTDLQQQAYETEPVVYMALELSNKKWRLALSDGKRRRQKVIEAGAIEQLREELSKTRGKWSVSDSAAVVSCYEAGRDGFWLHRQLEALGVSNHVVDAASIEVSRRARRVKTDRLDALSLLEKLMRYEQGEQGVWRTVRVPPVQWEDWRQLSRERDQLLNERTRHRNRLRSKLVAQGIRVKLDRHFESRVEKLKLWDGSEVPEHLKAGLLREWRRLVLVDEQLEALEEEVQALLDHDPAWREAAMLQQLKGIGPVAACRLWVEIFGWRGIGNRRQLAALTGLVPSPYQSGSMAREQGVGNSGNPRVRRLSVELAWLWVRHQPQSKHSRWFQERFGGGGKRQRRIGIVAMARRLLIDLWRFLEFGVVPEGARLKVSRR